MPRQRKLKLTKSEKEHYADAMAENLTVLRTKLGLSQTELGQLIGVSRQTISAYENKSRTLPWGNFTSLLFLFSENESTKMLLPVLGIYPPELMNVFRTTDLKKLKEDR